MTASTSKRRKKSRARRRKSQRRSLCPMDSEETSETAWSLTTLLIVAITLAIMAFLLATPAGTREVCLTKKEARQLWPRRHIYWYSSDHCWSNRRGPPKGIKVDPIDPVFPPKALAKEPEEASADNDHCCWPELDADASGNLAEPPLS